MDYFERVLVGEEVQQAVRLIRETAGARLRRLSDMEPVERYLRVLLFTSQNHFFDLKSAMRGYLHVDDKGSRLEFDDQSLPELEQALAGLHFLLEQKARLFRFGGGHDYANEILRNSLSAVFGDMGDSEPHLVQPLDPEASGAGAPLTFAERDQIAEAVNSLLSELDRGGAIDIVDAQEMDDVQGSFRWRPNAALAFAPSPQLESHEEVLIEQLHRVADPGTARCSWPTVERCAPR